MRGQTVINTSSSKAISNGNHAIPGNEGDPSSPCLSLSEGTESAAMVVVTQRGPCLLMLSPKGVENS